MRVSANSRSSTKLISTIDVSGFAAILTVLLALFMMPGLFMDSFHHGVTVELPHVGHSRLVPHARREDAITIEITRQGDVFLGRDLIRSYSSIPNRIRESIEHGSESTIYTQADARAKYRDVKDVIDEIHSAQVENIVFLVDQRKPLSPK